MIGAQATQTAFEFTYYRPGGCCSGESRGGGVAMSSVSSILDALLVAGYPPRCGDISPATHSISIVSPRDQEIHFYLAYIARMSGCIPDQTKQHKTQCNYTDPTRAMAVEQL